MTRTAAFNWLSWHLPGHFPGAADQAEYGPRWNSGPELEVTTGFWRSHWDRAPDSQPAADGPPQVSRMGGVVAVSLTFSSLDRWSSAGGILYTRQ